MTTPNQPAPDGAYVIAEGGDYPYGQNYTDSIVHGMFKVPVPTPLNMLTILAQELAKLPLEVLQLFKDLIPGWAIGAFDTISGAVSVIIGALENNPLTNAIERLAGLIDAIVQKLFGWVGSGFGLGDSSDALGQTADTLTKIAQAVAMLQAEASSGVNVTDDFERSASSSLGSNWDQQYTSGNGTWKEDGHNAYWDSAYPNGNRDVTCRWMPDVSTSNYQRVSVIMAGNAEKAPLGNTGHNDALGRMSSDNQNYIRFRVGGDGSCSIARFVSGSRTDLITGTCFSPGPGGVISLECGETSTSTLRKFRGLVNGVEALSVTESGTASMAGTGYQYMGHGGRAEGTPFTLAQQKPGRVAQWFGQDQ